MLKNTKKKQSKVQEDIALIHDKLKVLEIGSEEYDRAVKQLGGLYEIEGKTKWSISPDTVAVVACNLIGIAMVLKHEEFNVVTSKALGFIMKGRA